MTELNRSWNALRAILQNDFSFYDIKEIVGLAGLDLSVIAHLEQKPRGGASKGQLMTGIDKAIRAYQDENFKRFIAIVTEEVLKRRPDSRETLEEYLSRLGYTLANNSVIPIDVLDISALAEIPKGPRADLVKASRRLRDGDLSGAISAACGAVDAATSNVYAEKGLGDPGEASFQERCKKALRAKGILPVMEGQLKEHRWDKEDIRLFKANFQQALNQGAYIMQTLRSKMGDVHGTKPVLKPLVFDSIKWSELMIRALKQI